ncbi:MAG: DUF3168 domain-containing protein [Pseudomonadota bacterium]
MSDSIWALQRAIYQELSNDAGLGAYIGAPARIFDHPPDGAGLPYIVIGAGRASDWKGVDRGVEHDVRLHVYSRYAGRREIKEIMSAVYDALHEAAFAVDGHRLVNIRCIFSDALRRTDGETYEGVMRFRAMTQPL